MSTKISNISFEMPLKHDYRIVRYGTSDSLELEAKVMVNKKDGSRSKEWTFVGYHTTIPSAIKAYLRHCPTRKLKGKTTVQEYLQFMKDINEEMNKVIPEDIEEWKGK